MKTTAIFQTMLGVSIVLFLTHAGSTLAQVKPELDPTIPQYGLVSSIAGTLSVAGSETMKPLIDLWAGELRRMYPGLTVQVSGLGSETGLAALFEGKAQIAAMSRRMTTQEISEFMREFGYEPVEVPVAVDALAVFVHRDNPVQGLTLQELDAMFSVERKRGVPYSIDSWGLVGLADEWFDAPIRLYGRDDQSGTAAFFREQVCNGGKLRPSLVKSAGAASVVVDLMKDRFGIGFSAIGYKTSSVRPVPIAAAKGGRYVEPAFQTAMDGTYPLRRNLYLYVNRAPKIAPSPAIAELVKFSLSQQGQQIVINQGYFPLPTTELNRLIALWSAPVKAAVVDRTGHVPN